MDTQQFGYCIWGGVINVFYPNSHLYAKNAKFRTFFSNYLKNIKGEINQMFVFVSNRKFNEDSKNRTKNFVRHQFHDVLTL